MQLFCFTHAGGTAAFFDSLEKACRPEIEVVKLEYPGHGTRRKEKLPYTIHELSLDLYEQMREKYMGGKYALFGYSMGSIAAVEVLRYLTEKDELPQPEYIILAAHQPNIVVNLNECDSKETDEYVKNRTIRFGGIPQQLIDNKIFWRTYIPLLRADYLMVHRYDFKKLQFTSYIPALLFYSQEDIPKAEMEQWKRYFTGNCEFVEYTGGHFFINKHCEEMAALIKERLGCAAGDL